LEGIGAMRLTSRIHALLHEDSARIAILVIAIR
jgi:hypothetical protein